MESATPFKKSRYHQSESDFTKPLVPSILIGIYFFTLWKVPYLPQITWTWYMLLGLSGIAYLIFNVKMNLKSTRFLIFFFLLQIVGGYLSIIRAQDTFFVMYNLVGFLITFSTYILISQILLSPTSRAVLLAALFMAASIWSYEVFTRTQLLGESARLTFWGIGGDKNLLALLFSFVGTSALTVFFFWKPKEFSVEVTNIIRIILLVIIVYFMYVCLLLYSRSGLSTYLVGLLAPTLVYAFLKSNRGVFVTAFLLIFFLLTYNFF